MSERGDRCGTCGALTFGDHQGPTEEVECDEEGGRECLMRAENARLRAEVERLRVYHEDDEPSWRHRAEKLEAEVERLTREREEDRDAFCADIAKRAGDYDAIEEGLQAALGAALARAEAAEVRDRQTTDQAGRLLADNIALVKRARSAERERDEAREVLRGLVAWCEQGAWEGEDGSPDALNAARRALASALGRGEG